MQNNYLRHYLIRNLGSVKVYILITATVFFCNGMISEGSWKELVLIVAGIRSVDKAAGRYLANKTKGG
ncbi:MAG: hypothetical protein EBX40_01130 [Gammaproteobacteria bacterium]|nr:hypothetical protein [Gammaproteobacteria bacterium]